MISYNAIRYACLSKHCGSQILLLPRCFTHVFYCYYSDDMELCFQNAVLYNTRGTYIYIDAQSLRRLHKKTMQNIFGLEFFTKLNNERGIHPKSAEVQYNSNGNIIRRRRTGGIGSRGGKVRHIENPRVSSKGVPLGRPKGSINGIRRDKIVIQQVLGINNASAKGTKKGKGSNIRNKRVRSDSSSSSSSSEKGDSESEEVVTITRTRSSARKRKEREHDTTNDDDGDGSDDDNMVRRSKRKRSQRQAVSIHDGDEEEETESHDAGVENMENESNSEYDS